MEIIDQKEETSSVKKGWMASPRLSFSHDIPQTELLPTSGEANGNMVESQEMDFDFSTSLEVSMQEPSSADELFSDGKIVPLSMKVSPVMITATTTTAVKGEKQVVDFERKASLRTMIMDEDEHKKAAEWKPFWLFGRSGSVGSSGSTKPKTNSICPFRRSKSAGCNSRPIVSTTLKNKSKNSSSSNNNNNGMGLSRRGSSTESSSKTYYYSGVKRWSHGDGVRISPVLNVAGAYLPRGGSTGSCRSNSSNSNSSSSIFGYLLCKCSNKGMEMEMREVACSP